MEPGDTLLYVLIKLKYYDEAAELLPFLEKEEIYKKNFHGDPPIISLMKNKIKNKLFYELMEYTNLECEDSIGNNIFLWAVINNDFALVKDIVAKYSCDVIKKIN